MKRREFTAQLAYGSIGALMAASGISGPVFAGRNRAAGAKPNILFAISDDQSWPHAGAYGCKGVKTPAFDRLAREGVLFSNAFTAAPQCSPNRASILTGRNIWQNEEAGTHSSNFPTKFKLYTNILKNAGYHVGFTGKGWAPGNYQGSGNPAGKEYASKTATPPASGMYNCDYAANFKDFLNGRGSKPFCFWYGAKEPHRKYAAGSGRNAGKKLSDADVPSFLPDADTIRSDILDYYLEIEHFDNHLGKMLKMLEDMGELDNTIIMSIGDNGMPFPRAKATLYELGTHTPMAVRWGAKVKGGRVVDDLVSCIDIAPTFLEAAGITPPTDMSGRSMMNILTSDKDGRVDSSRTKVLTGRERHTHCRADNLGYPIRSIRNYEYLYIWNVKPDRWPTGEPSGYWDCDKSPSKSFLINNKSKYDKLFKLAFAKRPEDELYNIKDDPGCINNLAGDSKYESTMKALKAELQKDLKNQCDPRMLGCGDIFESYPRHGGMRNYPGFKERGKYNPEYKVDCPPCDPVAVSHHRAVTPSMPAAQPLTVIRNGRGVLDVNVSAKGRYTLRLETVHGKTLAIRKGARPGAVRIPVRRRANGVHLLRMITQSGASSTTVVTLN